MGTIEDEDLRKRELEVRVNARVHRLARRHYDIEWTMLDEGSLRAVWRLLGDLETEQEHAVRQARMQPWRR